MSSEVAIKEECLKYKNQIVSILEASDLSTVTTKSIRRTLEANNHVSLDPIKSQMNEYIMELYTAAEARKAYVLPPSEQKEIAKKISQKKPKKEVKKVTKKEETKKKETKKTVAKKTDKNTEPKVKKVKAMPVVRVKPPLTSIIGAEITTRPQAVKKMWEYIRRNNLQDPDNKSIIICDANFKALCEGVDKIGAFTVNKYVHRCFEKIPDDQQAELKQKFMEAILAENQDNGNDVE